MQHKANDACGVRLATGVGGLVAAASLAFAGEGAAASHAEIRADAGQYNFMHNKTGWVPGKGWPEMYLGSTLILWMQFTDRGPKGRSIMTYSQSDNPSSPCYLDQVQLYSDKKSKPILFSERDILADPNLEVTRVCAPAGEPECLRFSRAAKP